MNNTERDALEADFQAVQPVAEFEDWWMWDGARLRPGSSDHDKSFAARAFQAGRAVRPTALQQHAKLASMARDWQAMALREAAELSGTAEGAARLVESRRYGELADALAQPQPAEQVEENYRVSQIREGNLHGIKMALEDLKRGYIKGAQLRLMSILENAHKL